MKLRNTPLFRLFLYVAFFMIGAGYSAQAHAQETDIFARFLKPMPEIPDMEQSAFLEKTRLVRKKPYGQRSLEYKIRIPKDWEEKEETGSSNFLLSDKLFLELNKFYGRPTISGRSYIEVLALNVESDLTVTQWYLKYLLESGYTPEGFVELEDGSIESLIVFMDADYSYYLRTRAFINGKKVILVKSYVPIQYIQELAAMQKSVLATFELVNDVPRPEVEMEVYRFLDVAELPYPNGWRVIAKPLRSVDRMEVSMVNTGTEGKSGVGKKRSLSYTIQGKVDVNLVSSSVQQSLVNEIAAYKERVESSGVLISEMIDEEYDFIYHEDIDFGITEVYKGIDSSSKLSEYEFWFSVMVGGNYYYFVMLLTPSRNDSFAVWAGNVQSYKRMIKDFTPLAGAFLERD